MDSFRLTTAAILPFLVRTPLPPSVNHFLTWKPSQVALSSPHRGFYAEDGTCERCSSPCRTCEGNANKNIIEIGFDHQSSEMPVEML